MAPKPQAISTSGTAQPSREMNGVVGVELWTSTVWRSTFVLTMPDGQAMRIAGREFGSPLELASHAWPHLMRKIRAAGGHGGMRYIIVSGTGRTITDEQSFELEVTGVTEHGPREVHWHLQSAATSNGKSVKKGKTFDTPHHAPASTGHKRKHEGGTHPKDLTRQSSPQQIPAAPPHKKTKRAKGSQYVDTLTGISAPEPPPHWGQQDQDKAAVVNAYDASYGPSALPDHQLVDPPSRTRHNPKPSRLQREIDIERFTSGGKRASRATSNDEQQARAIAVPHGKMPKRAPTETAPAAPTAHAPTAVNKASASQKMSLKKKPTAGLHKPASQIEPARQVLLASNAPQAGLRRSPAEFGEIIKAYDADKWGPLLPNPPRYALDNIAKGLDPYLPPCPWCVNSGWNRDGWPLFNDPPNYRCPCGIIH